jgi:hypothetical protein
MAHQTSRNPLKQTTPRTIGRLMDADFSGVLSLLHMIREVQQLA